MREREEGLSSTNLCILKTGLQVLFFFYFFLFSELHSVAEILNYIGVCIPVQEGIVSLFTF